MTKMLLSLSALLGVSCTTSAENPLGKVAAVDLPRYMGDWYVIASIPTFLEKDAYNAVEHYELQTDGDIAIRFTFRKGSFDGPKKELTMTGLPTAGANGSEWRVRPFWPLSFPYYIVELAEDYSWVVVGTPNRKNLWIMARAPSLPEDIYRPIVKRMEHWGFQVAEIIQVPQKW